MSCFMFTKFRMEFPFPNEISILRVHVHVTSSTIPYVLKWWHEQDFLRVYICWFGFYTVGHSNPKFQPINILNKRNYPSKLPDHGHCFLESISLNQTSIHQVAHTVRFSKVFKIMFQAWRPDSIFIDLNSQNTEGVVTL